MKILIDLQGAQSENRFRGIGRYCLELVKQLLQQTEADNIELLLNGNLAESAAQIRKQFNPLISEKRIHSWFAPVPYSSEQNLNQTARQVALDIQQQLIHKIAPDIYFIPSFFEGFLENAVVDCLPKEWRIPTVVTSHDLIPMLYPELYLQAVPGYEKFYKDTLDALKRADYWIAISESSKNELVEHLGIPKDKITNTYEGADRAFKPAEDASALRPELAELIGIEKRYLIYSGGADPRKNLPRLIRAFALLPEQHRQNLQLVLVGKIHAGAIEELKAEMAEAGLNQRQVLFTGFIGDEDLIELYQHSLAYIFPSWHEGFGLPALEAMSCGIPVLTSNRTSLPEIVGHPDALFDPFDEQSISSKIRQIIEDEELRTKLSEHGLQQSQKFSWEKTARLTLEALKKAAIEFSSSKPACANNAQNDKLPRLAMVTPMPPEQTGIADYVFELLPALEKHFQIFLVLQQEEVLLPEDLQRTYTRDGRWFIDHAWEMDYIVYQMGNAPFHSHIFEWIKLYPGIVVLHDFYLSDLLAYLELIGDNPAVWRRALFDSHGYPALLEWCKANNAEAEEKETLLKGLKKHYPCNFSLVKQATRVVVHSEYSKKLVQRWYGSRASDAWHKLPLLRDTERRYSRKQAREALGIDDDTLLVTSFGIIAPSKLNHRLLEAWLEVNGGAKVQLVFVGKSIDADYQKKLEKLMSQAANVHITGWASKEVYHQYLAAADIAVQLRTDSRGETSAAVLDAMNYGLATIINANGAMAELPDNAVIMLSDDFSNHELAVELESLMQSRNKCNSFGAAAREAICNEHSPQKYAQGLANILHHSSVTSEQAIQTLLKKWHQQGALKELNEKQSVELARDLDLTFEKQVSRPTLYLDLTATIGLDLKTGIERYAKALARELVVLQQVGFNIELVYLKPKKHGWGYCTARQKMLEWLGCEVNALQEEWAEPGSGDWVLSLDLAADRVVQVAQRGMFSALQARGVKLYASVFDLLPVEKPHFFPPGTDEMFAQWLQVISRFDGVICISKSTAKALSDWRKNALKESNQSVMDDFDLQVVPMGVDFPAPKQRSEQNVVKELGGKPFFLMVGTIEPRKGHLQTIEAFEALWKSGLDYQLVIVGREGWQGLDDSQRRNLPDILKRLRDHPERGKRLHWLSNADDEQLAQLYKQAQALLVPSEGEGFGLPVIEAAHYACPVIARDLPVFREVANNYADFFENNLQPETMARFIESWMTQKEHVKKAVTLPVNSWRKSAEEIMRFLTAANQEE